MARCSTARPARSYRSAAPTSRSASSPRPPTPPPSAAGPTTSWCMRCWPTATAPTWSGAAGPWCRPDPAFLTPAAAPCYARRHGCDGDTHRGSGRPERPPRFRRPGPPRAGQHKGKTYTEQDLQDMVDNFHRFKGMLDPSAVIGHEEEAEGGQPLVEDEDGRPDPDLTAGIDNSGTPAVGWIADLRKRGPSLYADIEGVPPSIAKLINGRAYKKVSAEVYDHPEAAGLKGTGKVFRRVALLGGELPQIKRLSDLPLAEYGEYTPRDRYRRAAARFSRVVLKFSEIKTPSRRAPAGIHTCFFEVTKHMDRQAMLDFLAGQGVDISQITEAVPDEALMEIVKAWQSQASQDVNGDQAADHADHARRR